MFVGLSVGGCGCWFCLVCWFCFGAHGVVPVQIRTKGHTTRERWQMRQMRWSQKVTCCPKHRIHVSCTCGVPEVKGQPCLHTAKHALALGKDVSSVFHYKDTSAAWKEQYNLASSPPGTLRVMAQRGKSLFVVTSGREWRESYIMVRDQ